MDLILSSEECKQQRTSCTHIITANRIVYPDSFRVPKCYIIFFVFAVNTLQFYSRKYAFFYLFFLYYSCLCFARTWTNLKEIDKFISKVNSIDCKTTWMSSWDRLLCAAKIANGSAGQRSIALFVNIRTSWPTEYGF